MAVRFGSDFLATGHLTGLLLLASEALVVVLTVVRRRPAQVDRSVDARGADGVSMLGPPLVRPATVAALAPELATVLLSAVGLLRRHRRQDVARPQLRPDAGQPRRRLDAASIASSATRSTWAT